MTFLEREEFVKVRYISLWSLLAFQAGFINAFGFLSSGRYVSHVTGFGTQIGIALAQNNAVFAFELVGFPLCFILGSFTSAFMTVARMERGLKPRFDLVALCLPIIILMLFLWGQFGLFGTFGEALIQMRDFFLLFLLSFVCGMQNGCFATLTKGQIRTTHLTGISTDMGTDLARIWFGKSNPKEIALTRRVNFSRFCTLISFAVGSVFSVLVSNHLEYESLIVPFLSSIIVFFSVRRMALGSEFDSAAEIIDTGVLHFRKKNF